MDSKLNKSNSVSLKLYSLKQQSIKGSKNFHGNLI